MLADRAKRIKPSATLAMDAKAKAMKQEGRDIVNFGVGEPDFDTPDNIKEAAIRAIRAGFTKYTPAGGTVQLKEAVMGKFKSENGLTYKPEGIIVSCGAKHSLYNIAQALYGPGDEVIIPSPYWVSYPDQVLLNDATPVIVQTHEADSFMLRPEALKEKITRHTKAIILNSPSNPTGLTYDRHTLEAIAQIAVENNLYVISDEIYEHLIYDGGRHVSIASLGREIFERTIVVNGLSKAYAMTGWRIGYAAGPAPIIKAMTNIQGQSTSNPSSISQAAAIEALTGPQDFISVMRAEFDKRRKYLVGELNSIPGMHCLTPTGAFYAFPNTAKLYGGKVKNSTELSMYLLDEAMVALVPGEPFGSDDHIRISYAVSMADIEKAVVRIKAAIEKLV